MATLSNDRANTIMLSLTLQVIAEGFGFAHSATEMEDFMTQFEDNCSGYFETQASIVLRWGTRGNVRRYVKAI